MPDQIVKWRGIDVSVKETREPAMDPWDGDEPLDPGDEGYDLEVEATATVEGHVFRGFAQVAGNWIHPDREGYDFLDSQVRDLTGEALDALGAEVSRVASGEDVRKEEKRRDLALALAALKP